MTAAGTPGTVENRPGLDAISYRVADHPSLLEAMVERLASIEVEGEGGDEAGVGSRPLRALSARDAGDHAMALLDLWAYLGDILTFYQERIANEAFLRTATEATSLHHLAALVSFRPTPGKAATTHLAFTTERGARVEVPAGLRVKSVPGQDGKAQVFETGASLTAVPDLATLRPRATTPQLLGPDATEAVLAGTGLGLRRGDTLVFIHPDGIHPDRNNDTESSPWEMRRITAANEDNEGGTTTVTWAGELTKLPDPASGGAVEVHHLRSLVWPFGSNAPDWHVLAEQLKTETAPARTPPYANWNDTKLPRDADKPTLLLLDSVVEGIAQGDWLVLGRPDDAGEPSSPADEEEPDRTSRLYMVKGVSETVATGYTLTSRVSALTLDAVIPEYPMRRAFARTRSRRLPLAEVPVATLTRGGREITLDAVYPGLERGRTLMLVGERTDGSGLSGELLVVDGVRHGDGADADGDGVIEPGQGEPPRRTVVTLVDPTEHTYRMSTVRLHGNVVTATQGETVRDEVLGDGDATAAFQAFVARGAPVTHLADARADQGAASTATVRVGGIAWRRVPDLYGAGPDEPVYTEARDAGDVTTFRFGNGTNGARLPTGVRNVTVTYRKGHGAPGNVAAAAITNLADKPKGLKAVANPLGARGGTDADDPRAVRDLTPRSVRTLGRIVSLRDFEDAAREFVGVAKARAAWVWRGGQRVVELTVAGAGGAVVEEGTDEHESLVDYLDARRDPHQAMDVVPHENLNLRLAVDVVPSPARVADDVLRAARDALAAAFSFDARELGQPVHLSDLDEILHGIDGVEGCMVRVLADRDADPPPDSRDSPPTTLPVSASRIAILEDPDEDIVLTVVEDP